MKKEFMCKKNRGAKAGLIILFCAAMLILFGFIVMLLWNALLPGLLKLPAIGFWQAVGILALARILFGNHGRFHGRPGPRWGWQQRKLREKWAAMTPEQREFFREQLRNHCRSPFASGPWEEPKKEETGNKE